MGKKQYPDREVLKKELRSEIPIRILIFTVLILLDWLLIEILGLANNRFLLDTIWGYLILLAPVFILEEIIYRKWCKK